MDVFRNQAWDLGGRIANHVQQGHDIRTSGQVLEDFDFPLDFLLLDRFEDFDNAPFAIGDADTLENLVDWDR